MRNLLSRLLLLLFIVSSGAAVAYTSTINPAIPAANSPLTSAPMRGNFTAAYNDINNIYSLINGSVPSGANGSIQINNNGIFGPLLTDVQASYAAHNTIENGISYDPRDPAYGAICGGYNTFAGNGSTTAFTYTIPFTGSSPTDNSNFMVFYEPTNGSGSATILTTSQFSVTGVNSGSGGTITLNSAPPSANTLIVVHDDSAGLVAASVAAVASNGYLSVPKECTIYGSQTLGTQFPEKAQVIGQGFTPNYGFQGAGVGPIMRVIAPTGAAPAYGINISGKNQQFFEGFALTTNVPGANSLGFLTVPVLMGANTSSGAGGGQSPGIVAQYMTFNSGIVGFGAPIGGSSGYIFPVLRFNNFTANTVGVYGPLSDQQIIGNNFNSNGAFGTYGSAGGMVVGPIEGAPGASSAGRFEYNRFEFNLEGIVIQAGANINMDGNQFDANSYCGLDLRTAWNDINITGGWFRGNANGGGTFAGSTTAGRAGDICFNGGSGSYGLNLSNVNFYTNFGEGNTAPLGTTCTSYGAGCATTPPYVFDFNTAGANNDHITVNGGSAQNVQGNNGASVTDFAIFRNGMPPTYKLHIDGQPIYGENANGNNPSLVSGIPAFQSTSVIAWGDHNTLAPNTPPPGSDYGTLISGDMNATYTNKGLDRTLTCDSLDAGNVYSTSPLNTTNPLYIYLPSNGDPSYGGGGSTAHLADVRNCNKAAASWLATPIQYKVVGQNASCVQTGTWTNDSSFGGAVGVISATNGSTLTCTVSSYGAPLYAWFRVHDNDGGTFTYSVDGATAVSVNTAPNSSPTGDGLGDPFAESLIRVPYINAGTHTIVFTVTSATSASNNVYILGVGTAPNVAYYGGGPRVYTPGMPYQQNDTNSTIAAAYDAGFKTDAATLQQDGLNVNFVDIRKYMNSTTDLTSSTNLSTSGESHIRDAFEAQIQFVKNPTSSGGGSAGIDPRNYGASCNTKLFLNTYGSPNNAVNTTSGSNVISINNYTFVAGTATQTGGGDVGKMISIYGNGIDVGPTTYIASVNTTNNTATIGENMLYTRTTAFAVMGGYPSNAADPSTAQDDTVAIQNASIAAAAAGQIVTLPNACLVHNLQPANGVLIQGSMGGTDYTSAATSTNPVTNLYCSSNGFAEDPHTCINLNGLSNVRFKDFQLTCANYPVLKYSGQTLAGFGAENNTQLNPEAFVLDHISHFLCPVELGVPFAMNIPVSFTASISGTTMNVASIDSTNLANKYTGNSIGSDWLATGRKVTEATFTATVSGTTLSVSAVASGTIVVGQAFLTGTGIGGGSSVITALGTGTGGTGTYTINNSLTIGTPETMTTGTTITVSAVAGGTGNYTVANSQTLPSQSLTSPANTVFLSGQTRFNQFSNGGIDINGDFSDFADTGSVFTGGFVKCMWLGPNTGGSTGNSANRFSLERFEVCNAGAIVLDTTTNDQFNGVQWQFNPGYAIQTIGAVSDIQVTGGMMEGNGTNNGPSPGFAPQLSHINFSGSGSRFSVSGVNFSKPNFSYGGNTSYLFSTSTGSSIDYVSLDGGAVNGGYNVGTFNWAGNTPTHYRQNAAGIPLFDSTQNKFTASGCSNSSAVGGGTTGQYNSGTSGACTVTLTLYGASGIAQPNGWSCSASDTTTPSDLINQTASTTTTATLSGTTVSGDVIIFNCNPY